MRGWGLAWIAGLGVGLAGSGARAQPADVSAATDGEPAEAPPQQLGYAAMPGGLRAPSAETLPGGAVAVSLVGGYGFRNTLLSADHKLTRGIGDIALAYAPTPTLTLALAFDGRYDSHTGVNPAGDDGYVGDPHILARLGKPVGGARIGGQLGIWVPGKDAPSIAASAISFEVRGLASFGAGPGTISLSGGFRLDNSAKSVDDINALSVEDRVSLGVSDYHAIVAGAQATFGTTTFFGAEASTDVFVGGGAPGPILRAGANVGRHLTHQWSLYAFVQAAKVPSLNYADVMAGQVTIIPYEPLFTGGFTVAARFGGPSHAEDKGKGTVTKNQTTSPIEVAELAEVTGTVTDDTGKPVVGAKVTIKLKANTGTAVTDDKGEYAVSKLPIGKTVDGKTTLDDTTAEVTIEVGGKKPSTSTITLGKGPNKVPKIALDPLLPPGQLRVLVRAAGTGKPIANATIKIEPGGQTATSGADGTLTLDLPPGTYKATASIAGFKDQTLDVVIETNTVAIKNFELRK
ncbi:MAG TPA: carboxypeptidase regulatory-like domain-containing protein [Kofleriaceae bacterium]|nr:carboxypeptidase regulatory-like domain-containing protein [Kofleriaceae bacterium]